VSPVPPAVPTLWTPTNSVPTSIVCPALNLATLATLMFVSPACAFAASVVPGVITALLFSSTVFATDTLPTSQPARVYETHGAGAFFGCPESAFTMFGLLSTPPATGAVQYLNADVNVAIPFGW
jgi:hypothetical protein